MVWKEHKNIEVIKARYYCYLALVFIPVIFWVPHCRSLGLLIPTPITDRVLTYITCLYIVLVLFTLLFIFPSSFRLLFLTLFLSLWYCFLCSLFSFFLSFSRVGGCQLPFWHVPVKHYVLYMPTPGYGMSDQLSSCSVDEENCWSRTFFFSKTTDFISALSTIEWNPRPKIIEYVIITLIQGSYDIVANGKEIIKLESLLKFL